MLLIRKQNQSGFSLIEVLISTVILAVGLLGLAATQTVSMKHNNTGLLRSNALGLATKIADSIRANRYAARSYEVKIKGSAESIELPECFSSESGCVALTKAEMSQLDTYFWQQELKAIFPEGEIEISILEDNDPSDIDILLQVTLSWDKQNTVESITFDSGSDGTDIVSTASSLTDEPSDSDSIDGSSDDYSNRENYVFQVRP